MAVVVSKIDGEPCVAARPLLAMITGKKGINACNSVLRHAGILAVPSTAFKRPGSRGPEPAFTLSILKQVLPYVPEQQRSDARGTIVSALEKLGGTASDFEAIENVAILIPVSSEIVLPFLKGSDDGLPPRFVIPALLRALGVKDVSTYVREKLVPYLESYQIDVSSLCRDECRLQSPVSDLTDSERRIASASVGLRREVVPIYDHGRPTITGDLSILLLIVNELRTPEARALRVEMLETAALAMGLPEECAKDLVAYWRSERAAATPESILCFLGDASTYHVSGNVASDASASSTLGAPATVSAMSAMSEMSAAPAAKRASLRYDLEATSSNVVVSSSSAPAAAVKKIRVAKWIEDQMMRQHQEKEVVRSRVAKFNHPSHLIYEVCKKFAELHAIDEGMTDSKEAWKRLGLGAFGQKAVVVEDRLPLLQAALHFVLGHYSAGFDTVQSEVQHHISSKKRRGESSSGGYRCDVNSPHSLAKDRANDLFVRYLLEAIAAGSSSAKAASSSSRYHNVGYLDAFEGDTGFDLRTTQRLVSASPSLRLYSANRDGGVVRALRSNGAQAYEGEWRDAVQVWSNEGLRFRGFFLDFCNASAEFLLQEIRRVEPLLERPAVVAWTLPARDFGASPFSVRVTQIVAELKSKSSTSSSSRQGDVHQGAWNLAGGDAPSSLMP
jgi:hypothetical protein